MILPGLIWTDKLTRAALSIPQGQVNSDDIVPVNSGRWVRNIEITTACEFHAEIDGLLIDPAGVIYDATTRQPVSGATVRLLYNGELVNNDWLDDSGGKNSQITSSDGQYSFTLKADSAADGTYTIEVLPPTAYKFQSSQIPVEDDTFSPQLGGSVEERFKIRKKLLHQIKIQLIIYHFHSYLLMKLPPRQME